MVTWAPGTLENVLCLSVKSDWKKLEQTPRACNLLVSPHIFHPNPKGTPDPTKVLCTGCWCAEVRRPRRRPAAGIPAIRAGFSVVIALVSWCFKWHHLLFSGQIIFHWVYVLIIHHFIYSYLNGLFEFSPCIGYCKQCPNDHWGACVFLKKLFFWLYVHSGLELLNLVMLLFFFLKGGSLMLIIVLVFLYIAAKSVVGTL